MGLKKKKTESEKENFKNEKAEISRGESAGKCLASPPDMEEHLPTLLKLATLKAILSEVGVGPQLWPKEALRAILKRYERVPRRGLETMYSVFVSRFGSSLSSKGFKETAEKAVVAENGRKCSRTTYANESAKRPKTIDAIFEEHSLREFKLYTRVRGQLNLKLSNLKIQNIEECSSNKENMLGKTRRDSY